MTEDAPHLTIRPLLPADLPAVEVLICDAFGPEEGPIVVQLTNDLLRDVTALPLLALVAEHEQTPVGVVLFSAVTIEGHAELAASLLAPLAVAPALQRRGVGTALIAAGLQRLTAVGVELVLVYGSPAYYGRAGFRAADGITPPLPLSQPHGWQVRTLLPVQGRLRCADALQDARYW
jgi:putative acetyltransferase